MRVAPNRLAIQAVLNPVADDDQPSPTPVSMQLPCASLWLGRFLITPAIAPRRGWAAVDQSSVPIYQCAFDQWSVRVCRCAFNQLKRRLVAMSVDQRSAPKCQCAFDLFKHNAFGVSATLESGTCEVLPCHRNYLACILWLMGRAQSARGHVSPSQQVTARLCSGYVSESSSQLPLYG